jgi:hypothetical protein
LAADTQFDSFPFLLSSSNSEYTIGLELDVAPVYTEASDRVNTYLISSWLFEFSCAFSSTVVHVDAGAALAIRNMLSRRTAERISQSDRVAHVHVYHLPDEELVLAADDIYETIYCYHSFVL